MRGIRVSGWARPSPGASRAITQLLHRGEVASRLLMELPPHPVSLSSASRRQGETALSHKGRGGRRVGNDRASDRRHRRGRGRGEAGHRDPRLGGADSVVGAFVEIRRARHLRDREAAQDGAALRQCPLAGRADLPGAVADQCRRAADRAPPRLARCGAEAEGRDGDGGGETPRRGLHLDPRPRHRLGRRRPRGPYRRAEGRVAAGAADRPRQPPARRAVEGDPGAGQPLRGDRVPGGARRQLSRRAGHAADPARRARRARPARARHGLLGAVRCGRTLCRGARRPIPTATSTGRPSTASSISSRPGATRSGATSASPRSGRARTGCGASPTRASPSNTGSMPAPSSRRRSSPCGSRGAPPRASPGGPDGRSAGSRKASSRRSVPATRSSSPG